MCSLFLCLLLCLANFSVVASAAEDENLVSSNITNWDLGSNLDDGYIDPDHFIYNAEFNTSRIRVRFPSHEVHDFFGISLLYELPEIQVGQNYQYEFTIPSVEVVNQISPHLSDRIPSAFGEGVTLVFGIGYLDSDNFLNFYTDYGFSIDYSDFPDVIGQTFKQSFRLDNIKGTPVLAIMLSSVGSSESIVFLQNVSLTKVESGTDKKLDGILGWLEDIKNSITGLPEIIKTNLSTFFNDLSTKLTELKNNIKTNLETLGSNINGKLGDVSTDFSSYVSGLGDRVSSFFSDLKTNLTSEFTAFKNKVNTEFTNLKSNLTTNFDNLRSTLSSRFDKVDNFLTEIRDFFHNLYWDLVGGTCGAGDVHSSLFERLGDRIRGFFEDLKVKIDIKVEEIKTAIHDFFVPPEGFFEEWKANFDLMLSENLGFIYEAPYLIILFVTLAEDILDTDTEPSIIFPEISFELPGEYGCEIDLFEETEVDLSFLSESNVFSFLYYEAYPALLHVIFILALVGYAKYILGRTMSN